MRVFGDMVTSARKTLQDIMQQQAQTCNIVYSLGSMPARRCENRPGPTPLENQYADGKTWETGTPSDATHLPIMRNGPIGVCAPCAVCQGPRSRERSAYLPASVVLWCGLDPL